MHLKTGDIVYLKADLDDETKQYYLAKGTTLSGSFKLGHEITELKLWQAKSIEGIAVMINEKEISLSPNVIDLEYDDDDCI